MNQLRIKSVLLSISTEQQQRVNDKDAKRSVFFLFAQEEKQEGGRAARRVQV